MRCRQVLAVLTLVTLHTGAIAEQTPVPSQAADGKVAASIKDAVAGGKFTRIEGGDYKIDQSVRLSTTPPKSGTPSEAEVLYQVGVSSKDRAAIFLPVRTAPSESADTGKLIDQALSQMNISSAAAEIQACVGERTCAKLCDTGGGEYCCKWKCEKSKQ